jgi:hypothetical protein
MQINIHKRRGKGRIYKVIMTVDAKNEEDAIHKAHAVTGNIVAIGHARIA